MKTSSISPLSFFLLLIVSYSCQVSANGHKHFLECLSKQYHEYSISDIVHTITNSSYTSILQSSTQNFRFASESTPKPLMIITPQHESQIPPLIHCARQSGLEIRILSGGHDLEGLSYASHVPFVIIHLTNINEITIDVEEKTAWVGAGATLGSLYYRIAEKSPTLAFPAGVCPTVAVGGHFSGGGYGTLLRKYGLAADQIIDARIINVNGTILDRKSMGEDLFWAIRGGGGGSFGVIVASKVRLVDVPETVTVFSVDRTLGHNATQLVHRWQHVASEMDNDLFLAVLFRRADSGHEGRDTTVRTIFWSLFLGGADRLVALMQESFPELGLVKEECTEMSWIQSILYMSQLAAFPLVQQMPLEVLLNKAEPITFSFKIRSDYVKEPIPENGLEGVVGIIGQVESEDTIVYMVPYGGRMAEISESDIPFPHRAGNLYMLASLAIWQENKGQDSDRMISWSRMYYNYLTPYVSNSPREAYLNYRDLEIGVNNIEGVTSIEQASIWGKKYFKNNFNRLVWVKTVVDPHNFFKNEQSIPPLHSSERVHGYDAVMDSIHLSSMCDEPQHTPIM